MSGKVRYALIGTGGRSTMYINAVLGPHRNECELVAFSDTSATRMAWHNRRIGRMYEAPPVPVYMADDFDRMVKESRPDVVIVTSPDATHHTYIVRAMELGCDVICEKPMTTDAAKARMILDAIDRTGRSLRVTFNYRYAPHMTKVKQLLQTGVIGAPTAVDFRWVLDTQHGADYFRRWHAKKANSGGLLVHKATHHFDLVNWWLEAIPETVFAMGGLKFYGAANARKRGQTYDYDRYTGTPQAMNDPFRILLDRSDEHTETAGINLLKGLYLDAEAESGYIRDQNVFGDHIDIEDTLTVMARYNCGVVLNYSLSAYSPWEGFDLAITGTQGRIELSELQTTHVLNDQTDRCFAGSRIREERRTLRVCPMFASSYEVPIEKLEGGHGGADPVSMKQLFDPHAEPDPFGRDASHVDGIASMLLGACANESIQTQQPVKCSELLNWQQDKAKMSHA